MANQLSDPSVKGIYLDIGCASPQTLDRYLNWLYFGTFTTKRPEQTIDTIEGIPDDPEYLDLAQLWSLSIWLKDQQAADDVVNAFVAKMKETQPLRLPGPKCISHVFSPIYSIQPALPRLIATAYAAEASADQLKAIFKCTNETFHAAVAAELVALRIENRQKVASMNSCSFHAHAANEPCESNEKARKRRRLG
ncbi:hypothetical protein HII31_10901 [Pseudocercospora fuligena]|uniref:Uncharacterized protein n=1 Tax=Pseudocercospora fuligena TaxID=685502 RepID=A0A8H6VDY4_9PEZI|nr:hypothetical protein HII31_10901 [Pseudocercospora fuligena]